MVLKANVGKRTGAVEHARHLDCIGPAGAPGVSAPWERYRLTRWCKQSLVAGYALGERISQVERLEIELALTSV